MSCCFDKTSSYSLIYLLDLNLPPRVDKRSLRYLSWQRPPSPQGKASAAEGSGSPATLSVTRVWVWTPAPSSGTDYPQACEHRFNLSSLQLPL